MDEERDDVDLGVPEVVALVAAPGHALGGHAEALAAGRRLQELEQVEAHAALQVRGAGQLDVAPLPEVGDVATVLLLDRVVSLAARPVQRPVHPRHEVTRRRLRRPVVGDVLGQPQRGARLEVRQHDDASAVALRACVDGDRGLGLDVVLHAARHLESAVAGRELEDGARAVRAGRERHEHLLGEALPAARVVRGLAGSVGHQLGGDGDTDVLVERDDLVVHGGQVAILERGEPARADQHAAAARGLPFHLAAQHAGAEIEHALEPLQPGGGQVQGLVVDEEADDRAVGGVDDRLTHPRQPVGVLGIEDRPGFVQPVEDHAGVV